jgi:hypothetical protein
VRQPRRNNNGIFATFKPNEHIMMTKTTGSYTHFPSPMKSYLLSILAILAAAVPGVWLAWLAMSSLGLQRIPLALATAFVAMVISVVFFAALVAIGRALRLIK